MNYKHSLYAIIKGLQKRGLIDGNYGTTDNAQAIDKQGMSRVCNENKN